MSEIASAYVTLLPSFRGGQAAISREMGGAAAGAGREGGKAYGKAFGGALGALGAAGLGVKAFGFLKDSVGAASDLSETVNKSTVIFGANARAMTAWSRTAATKLGLSQQAALESAASFGDMFSQIGFTGEQAAKMSRSVVQLSADLGSFNNLDTAEVNEMIAASFRGEYDSLQRVIPNINAARVETEALARTHKKSAKELTAAEKAAATLAIIHRDGARAAGDFARTSDGLANSQKIAAAKVEDLKAKLGKDLLPAQQAVTEFLANKAVPAVSKFIDQMHTGEGAGGDFADVLGDLRDIGEGLVKVVDAIPGPVKKFGVEALIAYKALGLLQQGAGSMTGRVSALSGSLRTVRTDVGLWRSSLSQVGPATERVAAANQRMASRLQAVGGAARNVAGVGGMLALTAGMQSTNKSTGALLTTMGGAAAGFAAGGPIGAAVGGLAGLTVGLWKSTGDAAKAARDSIPSWKAYASTLGGVAGDVTAASRQFVSQALDKDGGKFRELIAGLGLEGREAVNAITGTNLEASKKLTSGLIAEIDRLSAAKEIAAGNGDKYSERELRRQLLNLYALQDWVRETELASAKQHALNLETADFSTLLSEGIPKAVVTDIDANGITPTATAIAELQHRYDLTPKQVSTLIEAVGVPATTAQVLGLTKDMKDYDKLRPRPVVSAAGVSGTNAAIDGVRSNLASLDGDIAQVTIQALMTAVTAGVSAGAGVGGRAAPHAQTAPRVSERSTERSGVAGAGTRLVLVLEDGRELGAFVREQAAAERSLRRNRGGVL